MRLFIFFLITFFITACSITHVSRDENGISFSNYSVGVDRENVDMRYSKDEENKVEAHVTIGDSNQTLGLTKAKEITGSVLKKSLIPLP